MASPIRHIWSVLCKKSVTDSQSNNISLFEALEQVNIMASDQKVAMPSPSNQVNVALEYELVILLARKNDLSDLKSEMTVSLRDPKGMVLGSKDHQVVFKAGKRRLRLNIKHNALPVTGRGIYEFEVYLPGKDNEMEKVASVPLEVTIG